MLNVYTVQYHLRDLVRSSASSIGGACTNSVPDSQYHLTVPKYLHDQPCRMELEWQKRILLGWHSIPRFRLGLLPSTRDQRPHVRRVGHLVHEEGVCEKIRGYTRRCIRNVEVRGCDGYRDEDITLSWMSYDYKNDTVVDVEKEHLRDTVVLLDPILRD